MSGLFDADQKASVRYLSKNDAIAIHDLVLERFGGETGLRDENALMTVLDQPMQAMFGIDFYPTLSEKAARYVCGFISSKPFNSGNVRMAAAVMGAFLRANGLLFRPEAGSLREVMTSVVAGTMSCEELTQWIACETGEDALVEEDADGTGFSLGEWDDVDEEELLEGLE